MFLFANGCSKVGKDDWVNMVHNCQEKKSLLILNFVEPPTKDNI